MQIINKIDVVFLWIYSIIIISIGVAGAVGLGNIRFLIISLCIMGGYLFLNLRRPYRRYRALKKTFPETWKMFLLKHSLFYKSLDETGKKHFERDVQIFLREISIVGTQGKAVTLETKLLVAAGAATLLHGRPSWEPPFQDGVVIFPGDRFDRHFRPGKGHFGGMATHRGPMLLTEASLEESSQHLSDGYNVVYHEMAHYFDFGGASIPWKELITQEWQKAAEGRSFLRDYAGVNETEFFAVAAEAFFENPWVMAAQSPELYEALKTFFNLDTAKILKRVF
ncbi:MAG: zinc-dependent peptidase [Acidobacteria bacterium]|jgi:hypothetical protein|nr:zinc-dependent peptidase [Acidobacteriota bacterium]